MSENFTNCDRDLFGQASHGSQTRVKPNGRDLKARYTIARRRDEWAVLWTYVQSEQSSITRMAGRHRPEHNDSLQAKRQADERGLYRFSASP